MGEGIKAMNDLPRVDSKSVPDYYARKDPGSQELTGLITCFDQK